MVALEGHDESYSSLQRLFRDAVIILGSHSVKRYSHKIKGTAGESWELSPESGGEVRTRSWWVHMAPSNTGKGRGVITCIMKQSM